MIVNAVPEADPPHALVEGIQSGRALSTLVRAVMHWYAFGRYDYVLVDLSSFGDWSPPVADELAVVAGAAADAGHWLAFFPVATCWMRGADDGRLHTFPDLARAQRAMQQRWFAQAGGGVARRRYCRRLSSHARSLWLTTGGTRAARIAPGYATTDSRTF